jgi:hypothetical protein
MTNKRSGMKLMLVLAGALALAVLFLAARPAAAGTDWIEFEAFNIQCEVVDQGKMWISDDGILHIRDMVYRAVVVSESPTHNGTAHIVASVNRDLSTGSMTAHTTLEIYPFAFPDGYWAGTSNMQGHDGGLARLRGYGELEGRLIKADLTPLVQSDYEGYAEECGGITPVGGVRSHGYVIIPGGE